jgi:8-oxo-dGTP pyrophosphatase MutT (NUDIX family)
VLLGPGEGEDIIDGGSGVMRQRGTAIVIKYGKVLLVRDRGHHKFSLPGGGIHEGEPVVSAAARELYEELGLHITSVKRVRKCDFKGSLSEHKVCLIEANGEPHLRGKELDKFIWWDMKTPIPIYSHVIYILKKLKN